jgi:hypothetical protein
MWWQVGNYASYARIQEQLLKGWIDVNIKITIFTSFMTYGSLYENWIVKKIVHMGVDGVFILHHVIKFYNFHSNEDPTCTLLHWDSLYCP